jgi:hypothetical protein
MTKGEFQCPSGHVAVLNICNLSPKCSICPKTMHLIRTFEYAAQQANQASTTL